MTAPRQVLEGATYLVTRRCSERRFFLKPTAATSAIFLYVLAVAAQRYGIRVHAFCVLSNHYHLVVTDLGARLPAFMQYLDALVARAVNASIGRWEGFWASGASYSAVTPGQTGDVVRKIAYVLRNPVAARLVRSARDWPGLWTAPEQLGTASLRVARPAEFFRSNGTMPETAELELTLPPGFARAEELRDRVLAELKEMDAADPARPSSFLGVERVLAQNVFASPASFDPRRRTSPRVACVDKCKRLEVIERLAAFLDAYALALERYRAGARDVLFPAGTYLMRVCHGVACASAG